MSTRPTLNDIERRVFGVLIEKSLAQPQYYPMTLNAVMAACNQKSNRDPEMNLDEDAVYSTLEVLRAGGLVSRVMPGGGSRVERYRHEAKEVLGWEKPQRAIMSELLLRGPQTAGELRGRCARMYAFENTESVQAVLDGLAAHEPALVDTLPRAPGQSAVRYAHRLYTDSEWERLGRSTAAAAPASASSAPAAAPAAAPGDAERVELRAALADLQNAVDDLRRRVDQLESRG